MRMTTVDGGRDLTEIGPAPAQGEHIGNRTGSIDQCMGVAAGATVIGTLDETYEQCVVEVYKDPAKPQPAGQRHDDVACLVERGQAAFLLPITTHSLTPNPPIHGRLGARLAKAGGEGNTPVSGICHVIPGASF